MRLALFLLFVTFYLTSFSQISIDFGARKQVESMKYSEVINLITPSFGRKYINDYFAFRCNYEYKRWLLSTELSYMPKTITLSESKYESNSGSHVSYAYSANAHYGYMGLRFGLDRKFFQKKFNLLLGISIQSDIKLYENEFNHNTYYSISYDDITYYPSSYSSNNEFNAMYAQSVYFLFGPNLTFRYNLKKSYIDLGINSMFSNYHRISISNPNLYGTNSYKESEVMQINGLFISMEFGVKYGFYLFREKEKTNSSDRIP